MNKFKKLIKCLFGVKQKQGNSNQFIEKVELPFETVAGFINHATHDYIGARILLLQGIPGPGAVMAVTALEKILKSYILELGYKVRRDGKGHNLESLRAQIDKHDNKYLTKAERKFLSHLNNAYKLRYPTEIADNFETFLPAKKILANLDSLFCKFIESETLDPISKDKKWYDMFKKGAMPKSQLINNNVYFGKDRLSFVESCQWYVAYFPTVQGNKSLFRTTDNVNDNSDWSIPDSLKN